jgi:hypothetical protein
MQNYPSKLGYVYEGFWFLIILTFLALRQHPELLGSALQELLPYFPKEKFRSLSTASMPAWSKSMQAIKTFGMADRIEFTIRSSLRLSPAFQ